MDLTNPTHVGAAGAIFNSGMLLVNCGFSNPHVARLNPTLFSKQGQLGVLVWGFAYACAAHDASKGGSGRGSAIWLAFAVEKLWYVLSWIQWHHHRSNDGIKEVQQALAKKNLQQILAAVFHMAYGAGDALFGLAFLRLWLK